MQTKTAKIIKEGKTTHSMYDPDTVVCEATPYELEKFYTKMDHVKAKAKDEDIMRNEPYLTNQDDLNFNNGGLIIEM